MSNLAPDAKPLLAGDGWRKRAGDFYTRPLAPGVLGLLALAADRDVPHQWRLRPYVGVVHQRVFGEVANAARDVGIPWMQKRTSLEAIVYELRDGNGPWRRTPYLTAALWMKGDVVAAEAWLTQMDSQFERPAPEIPLSLDDAHVTRFGSSAPPEGWPRKAFDAFARRLREGMAQYPEGPPAGWRAQPD